MKFHRSQLNLFDEAWVEYEYGIYIQMYLPYSRTIPSCNETKQNLTIISTYNKTQSNNP